MASSLGCVEQTEISKADDLSNAAEILNLIVEETPTIWEGPKPSEYFSPLVKSDEKLAKLGHSPVPKMFHSEPPPYGEYVFMEALFPGKLIVIEGCVQIKAAMKFRVNGKPLPNEKYAWLSTPVWPDYVKLIHDGADYKLDVKGQILSFGEVYGFGGGGGFGQRIAPSTRQKCPDTGIWYVGDVGKYP